MIDKNKIYAVHDNGQAADFLAMNLETDRDGFSGICFLTPPDHGHMIEGKIKKETRTGFIFSPDRAKGTWEFIALTYENFKETYHKMIYGGEQLLELVHSTEELEEYYHSNFPDYT